MMQRRKILARILGALMGAGTFDGAKNQPRCAVCGTRFQERLPPYALIVMDMSDRNQCTLPNTRLLVCQECGTCKVVAA